MTPTRRRIRHMLDQRVMRHSARKQAWTCAALRAQSDSYRGTYGCSEENGGYGFRPAFLDTESGIVYPSRFGNGAPAPFHSLDGLPAELIVSHSETGRVTAVKGSLQSGFVRAGRFYTRDQAAAAVATLPAAA